MKKFLINLVPIGKIKHKLQARFLKRPELNITRNSKCLMVCPHPDDEMIGAGACMIEHHRNFDCVCISSSGLRYKNITPRQRSDIRINEFNAVMDFVGVKNRYIFETFGVPPFISQIKRHFWDYTDTLDTQKYDYIFLPHQNDNHPEHRFVSNILMKRILRKNGFNKDAVVVFYEVWEPVANANCYYCFDEKTMDKKCAALDMYKSQNVWIKYSERIKGLNIYRGMLAGNKQYAEAYKLVPVKKYIGGGL